MQAKPNMHASYFAYIDSDTDGIYDFALSYLPDKNRNPRYIHDIAICDITLNETTNCNDFAYGNSKIDNIVELEIPIEKLPFKFNNNYNIFFKIYDNVNQEYAVFTTSTSISMS